MNVKLAWRACAAFVLVLAFSRGPHAMAQEAIFVVRHTAPPAFLSLDEIRDDTPLSESGLQRAQALASRLRNAGITAIYASPTLRTVQTAEPLALALRLDIQTVARRDYETLVRRVRGEQPNARVLVVGHWSTVPEILRALGHPAEVRIERTAYDEIFLVVPRPDAAPLLISIHY